MSDPADARPGLHRPARHADRGARPRGAFEAEQLVRVFVDPDLGGADQGNVAREAGEDAGRHARRAATLDRLFANGR